MEADLLSLQNKQQESLQLVTRELQTAELWLWTGTVATGDCNNARQTWMENEETVSRSGTSALHTLNRTLLIRRTHNVIERLNMRYVRPFLVATVDNYQGPAEP
jgi:hypothetical protein